MADFERELNWDDEITDETGSFEPLPEGDYSFTVAKIERARSSGSGKLPPCNMAKVTLTVHGAENDRDITENLVLHSSLEWKLSQFFLSIGLKKHGEPLRMNWTAATGKTGNCHVGVRTFKRKDGGEGTSNEIVRFYAYDEFVQVVQPAAQTAYQQPSAPAYQPSYQQPSYQQPSYQQPSYQQPSYQQPSYQQPSAPAASGWKPGSF